MVSINTPWFQVQNKGLGSHGKNVHSNNVNSKNSNKEPIAGGLNHLFRRIIFSIHGQWRGKCFLKNCISFLRSEDIIVIEYNFSSFLHNFMENISVLTNCNVLFYNEHLLLIWFFSLINNKFDIKITLRILIQKIIKYINENPQNRFQ